MPVTMPQAKTLAFIRQRGGEVAAAEIPTYRYRSVDYLERVGFLQYVPCGACEGCRYGNSRKELWHCSNLRIRYIG